MVTQRDAYKEGYDTGYEIARMNAHLIHKLGVQKFVSMCHENEDHQRQYSPFDFTAHDFNESRNPDGVWDAYEKGVSAGINAAVREYKVAPKQFTKKRNTATKQFAGTKKKPARR